jgi:hypothetical protein
MKNKLFGVLFSLLLIIGTTQSAHAYINNWYFDNDGVGPGARDQIDEQMDIGTPNFVDITPTGASTFDFVNYGFVQTTDHDYSGLGYSGPNDITAIFRLTGNGVVGGDLFFTGGDLTFYVDPVFDYGVETSLGNPGEFYGANNGTPIAIFDVLSGTGSAGNINNTITVRYEARTGTIASGYFIMPDGTTDLADPGVADTVRGITTTNAILRTPDNTSIQQRELLAYSGYGGLPEDISSEDFFLRSGGQFRLEAVPVPSAVFLLGSGLAALVGIRRKNS